MDIVPYYGATMILGSNLIEVRTESSSIHAFTRKSKLM